VGADHEEQLANLIALGCGTAQRYFLGRPLDAGRATELVEGQVPDMKAGTSRTTSTASELSP